MVIFKMGDQVEHEYLGRGVVTTVVESFLSSTACGYLVRFEVDPPVEYNMRENPTFVLSNSVSGLTNKE